MRILVIGASGMLGHKLVQQLGHRFDVFATMRGDFQQFERYGIFDREKTFASVDVQNSDLVETAIERCEPEIVINAVGIVKQVPASNNIIKTLRINAIFPHQLAEMSAKLGFRLITVSTDCVFAGTRGMYAEVDRADATDLYGQSKHWGEVEQENCLTIRTSIIGRELGFGHGLLEWFITQRNRKVNGYANAVFSGFPTAIFADIIGDISERYPELSGVFHISSDPISKFELLNKINAKFGLGITVEKCDNFLLDRSLDSSKFRVATGFQPFSWDDMIDTMAKDRTPYDKWNRQNI